MEPKAYQTSADSTQSFRGWSAGCGTLWPSTQIQSRAKRVLLSFGAAFVLLLCCPELSAEEPRVQRHQPIRVSIERQLFFDDFLIEARSGLTRVVHRPSKQNAPILVGDTPWENWTITLHGRPCILFDPEEKIYKMWYQGYHIPHNHYFMCYATSQDGLHWKKPVLGIEEFGGSRSNNIVLQGNVYWALVNVIRDEHETDPERRYKALSYDFAGVSAPEEIPPGRSRPNSVEQVRKGRPVGIALAFSADGIHWKLHPGNPVMTDVGDSHNVLPWDDQQGAYFGYFRPSYKLSGGLRVIGFSSSQDFIHWTPPKIILRPDELDPIGDEFYQMPVFRYQKDYIGFLWVYHNSPHPSVLRSPGLERLADGQQSLDTQLNYSRGGRRFLRVGDRTPWLSRGEPGDWDEGFALASEVIPRGDQLWIYYGGGSVVHNAEAHKELGRVIDGRRKMMAIGLARIRQDGFVSLSAGRKEGVLTTRQILLEGQGGLRINVNASGGAIAAEILDSDLAPIEGYAREDCRVFSDDSISASLIWKNGPDFQALQGRAVRFRLYLRQADLYALQLE